MYIFVYLYMHTHIYAYTYLCMYIYIYIRIHIYVCMCACEHVYIYIYICIHVSMSSNRCGKFGSTITRKHNRAKEICWQHTRPLQTKLLLMTTLIPLCAAPWLIFHISYLIDRRNSAL